MQIRDHYSQQKGDLVKKNRKGQGKQVIGKAILISPTIILAWVEPTYLSQNSIFFIKKSSRLSNTRCIQVQVIQWSTLQAEFFESIQSHSVGNSIKIGLLSRQIPLFNLKNVGNVEKQFYGQYTSQKSSKYSQCPFSTVKKDNQQMHSIFETQQKYKLKVLEQFLPKLMQKHHSDECNNCSTKQTTSKPLPKKQNIQSSTLSKRIGSTSVCLAKKENSVYVVIQNFKDNTLTIAIIFPKDLEGGLIDSLDDWFRYLQEQVQQQQESLQSMFRVQNENMVIQIKASYDISIESKSITIFRNSFKQHEYMVKLVQAAVAEKIRAFQQGLMTTMQEHLNKMSAYETHLNRTFSEKQQNLQRILKICQSRLEPQYNLEQISLIIQKNDIEAHSLLDSLGFLDSEKPHNMEEKDEEISKKVLQQGLFKKEPEKRKSSKNKSKSPQRQIFFFQKINEDLAQEIKKIKQQPKVQQKNKQTKEFRKKRKGQISLLFRYQQKKK